MVHLATHDNVQEVVGVDGVQKAIDEFRASHPSLDIQKVDALSRFDSYEGEGIKLFKGNFFHFSDFDGEFDMVWDRGKK